jgi:hypothetical protein
MAAYQELLRLSTGVHWRQRRQHRAVEHRKLARRSRIRLRLGARPRELDLDVECAAVDLDRTGSDNRRSDYSPLPVLTEGQRQILARKKWNQWPDIAAQTLERRGGGRRSARRWQQVGSGKRRLGKERGNRAGAKQRRAPSGACLVAVFACHTHHSRSFHPNRRRASGIFVG